MRIFYRNIIKPFCDIFIGIIAFSLLSPIFFIVCVMLLFANKGKVFFIQPRPGKNGNIFNIIKFKTMNDFKDAQGNLLPDDKRLTPSGKFVRKTSLDEIPQILNVIKGDMSFVGPRPLLTEYLPLYNQEQKQRHDVKPGITGWAQINGRNAISWPQKFEYDVWYVKNQSFLLDLKILLLTVKKVIIPEGISSTTSVTMEKFTGNE